MEQTKKGSKCNCVNVEVGSYDNQVELIPPAHMLAYKRKQGGAETICVDKCLEKELVDLWRKGITTTGCCCGHNKCYPYIGVIDQDIPIMKEMGYLIAFNPLRPGDEDSFRPKLI